MLALAFFSWWYSRGWQQLGERILNLIKETERSFSVSLLIRTLFKPWRRIITYPGSGLAAHFQSLVDNSISRLVGLAVRLAVLFAALITTIVLTLIGGVLLLIWPLLPAGILLTLILGFTK
jgi:hypothetical protein